MRIFWIDTLQGPKLPVVMLKPGVSVADATLLAGETYFSSEQTYSLFGSSFQELTDFLYDTSSLWSEVVLNNGRNLTLAQADEETGTPMTITIDPLANRQEGNYGGYGLDVAYAVRFYYSKTELQWENGVLESQGSYQARVQNLMSLTPASNARAGVLVMDDDKNFLYGSFDFENEWNEAVELESIGVRFSSYWHGFVGMNVPNWLWGYQTGEIKDYSDIPEPPDPTTQGGGIVSLANRFSPRIKSGAFGVYPLTNSQTQNVMKDLWSTGFFEAFNYEILGSPIDSILSLKWYYGIKGDIRQTTGDAYLTIGNVAFNGQLGSSPAIVTKPALSEFVNITMGDVVIPVISGPKFLNTSPYNEIQLYIPYVGFVSVDTSNLYGKRLRLDYNLNIGTGTAIAFVYSAPAGTEDWRVELEIPCEMGTEIPLNINAQESLKSRLANAVMGVSTTVIGTMGGLGAVYGMSKGLDTNKPTRSGKRIEVEAGVVEGLSDLGDIDSPRADFKRSGGASSESGSLAYLRPFLLIAKSEQAIDVDSYRKSVGFSDFKSGTISNLLEGNWYGPYLEVGSFIEIPDNDIPKAALDEVLTKLKAGVYYDR